MNPSYGLVVLARRKGDHAATVKQLKFDDAKGYPVLKSINPLHEDAEALNGWGAIAYLVGIIRNESGTEMSWYNPNGLRP